MECPPYPNQTNPPLPQRSEDHELAERLKAFILHLRKRDPQFSTQDAMEDALAKGLFSTAAKVRQSAPACRPFLLVRKNAFSMYESFGIPLISV